MSAFDLRAVEAGIAGTEFAGCIMHFPSVGSTNALALEAAQGGARGGVWVADEQTAGRGRGGPLMLSLATGLAAQAAIAEVTELQVDIRWPNDLLVRGRKCGGILVETAVAPAMDDQPAMLRYAVIGVGINLNHEAFPAEIELLATSLRRESGVAVSREAVLAALLRRLDEEIRLLTGEYRGTLNGQRLLERFAAASSWVRGKRVSVDECGGYTGVTAGLDAQGFLRVAGDDGVLRTVLSGGVREI